MKTKIYQLETLKAKLPSGVTTVLTNGCFDILHIGHVRYLQQARQQGDCLIVGINSDSSVRALKGPERPINSEMDRAELLAALECVDYVTVFSEATADHLIEALEPALYVKAGDYTLETLPEKDTLLKHGVEARFMDFQAGHSTTHLIEKMRS